MILVVGAIVVDSLVAPTRLLAARRSVGSARGWEFPGGKVESGEEPLGALRRELIEELSIEVEIGAEFRNPTGETWPIDEGHSMRTWFAEIRRTSRHGGEPMPTGSHDELRWLGADQVLDVTWLAADRPIVTLLLPWLVDRHPSTDPS